MNSLNEQLTGTPGQNEEVHIEMAAMGTDAVDLKKRRFHLLSEFMVNNGLDAGTIFEFALEMKQEVESRVILNLYPLHIFDLIDHCPSFRRSGRMT